MGVFAAYATTHGRALVDRELYLPKSWTDDRERCRAAKIPDERVFAAKPELARAMVLRALASPLPIAWVTADAAYGQEWRFRRVLEETAVGYVLAVPKSQPVPRFCKHLPTRIQSTTVHNPGSSGADSNQLCLGTGNPQRECRSIEAHRIRHSDSRSRDS